MSQILPLTAVELIQERYGARVDRRVEWREEERGFEVDSVMFDVVHLAREESYSRYFDRPNVIT